MSPSALGRRGFLCQMLCRQQIRFMGPDEGHHTQDLRQRIQIICDRNQKPSPLIVWPLSITLSEKPLFNTSTSWTSCTPGTFFHLVFSSPAKYFSMVQWLLCPAAPHHGFPHFLSSNHFLMFCLAKLFSHLAIPYMSNTCTCTPLNSPAILIAASFLISPVIPFKVLLYIISHLFVLFLQGGQPCLCPASMSQLCRQLGVPSAWAPWGLRTRDTAESQNAQNMY